MRMVYKFNFLRSIVAKTKALKIRLKLHFRNPHPSATSKINSLGSTILVKRINKLLQPTQRVADDRARFIRVAGAWKVIHEISERWRHRVIVFCRDDDDGVSCLQLLVCCDQPGRRLRTILVMMQRFRH